MGTAINICTPRLTLPKLLPAAPAKGRTIVVGAGKAAAEMAGVVNETLDEDISGTVVTRYGFDTKRDLGAINVLEAGHPAPDENSVLAAHEISEIVSNASSDDRIIFLISGGGSALMTAPIDGLSFDEKRAIHKHLVLSGAPIDEINFIRQHLSKIKGGRLAAMAPIGAELYSFIISDVIGDDPTLIASGPSVSAEANPELALKLLGQYGWDINDDLRHAVLSASAAPARLHKIKIIARNKDALDYLQSKLAALDLDVVNLGDACDGGAAETGAAHAKLILDAIEKRRATAILSGGELTVRIKNQSGTGGPNQEYIAALMLALPDELDATAIAVDSDGIDGNGDVSGAFFTPEILRKARHNKAHFQSLLANNNSTQIFEELGGIVKLGPTRTNVNDLRLLLVNHE